MNENIKKNWGLMNDEQRNLLRKKFGDDRFNGLDTAINQINEREKNPANTPAVNNQPPKQETQPAPVDTPKYDPNEQFDNSRFVAENKDVKIQVGTGKETGFPDYQDNSEARQKEIVNNLNAYWQDNPEFFRERSIFNQSFNYTKRNDSQKALLDSFWKKQEDNKKIAQYNNPDQVVGAIHDGEITTDQMDLLKNNNRELYEAIQKKIQDEINIRIVNRTVPNDPHENLDKINEIINKFNLPETKQEDFQKNYRDMLEKYGVLEDTRRMRETQDRISELYMNAAKTEERIRSELGGKASAGYIQAKINKTITPMYKQAEALQQGYTAMLNGRNQNLAIVNQDTQYLIQNTQEQTRVFNTEMKRYGFAMDVMNYETPEQKRQNELYMMKSKNALSVEHKQALLELQENFTNPDINSVDPKEQKRALNTALSGYYSQYGDIIIRSQMQATDDIIKYAKDNNVSIGEALTKNFIEPLQAKKGFKNVVDAKYGLGENVGQSKWKITTDENGKIKIEQTGKGDIPEYITKIQTKTEKMNYLKNITVGVGDTEGLGGAVANIPDGVDMGQCGQFVNRIGIAIGDNPGFGDSLQDKIRKTNSDTPEVGSFVVMDTGAKLSSGLKAGHVGVVTGINGDGTITITDSNWNGDERVLTHKLTQAQMSTVKGYRSPKVVNEGISSFDYAKFNNSTFKPQNIKTDKEKRSYQQYLNEKNAILSNPEASAEEILKISVGGSNITDTSLQKLDKFSSVIASLGDIEKQLKKVNSGPIQGILTSKNPYDTQAKLLQAQLIAIIPNLARGVYGEVGVLTDNDIKLYQQTIPNLRQTEDVQKAVLAMTLKTVQRGFENSLKTQVSAGKDVSGFIGQLRNIQNQVSVIEQSIGVGGEETPEKTDNYSFARSNSQPSYGGYNANSYNYFNMYGY